MTPRIPDFDDLAGSDLPADERERLRRVHDLLIAAGPPPELTPALAEPPRPLAAVSFLPARRRSALLLLAAALAASAFGGGYLIGGRKSEGFKAAFPPIAMHGTTAAPHALASLKLAALDDAGNWPMILTVKGLKRLPRGSYYELFLTKNGRLGPSCGTFRVHGGTTSVHLNAPYHLRSFNGWVVISQPAGDRHPSRPLLTT
jgi:hypothetical protein